MLNEKILQSKFKEEGFDITGIQAGKFLILYNCLCEWNKKFNLTSIDTDKEIIQRHFIESILILKCDIVSRCETILDIGSGAGFPGLPLSIMLDSHKITMIEATAKKSDFIQFIINKLYLTNASVINNRAEELAFDAGLRHRFDLVIARALAKYPLSFEIMAPFAKVKGFIAYFVSSNQIISIQNSISGFKVLGLHNKGNIISINDTSLFLVKKLWKTPNLYPRSFNKIKTNPIGLKQGRIVS